MVKEIALDRIGAYADHLRGPHIELVVQAAMAGNSAAQLWEIRQPEGPALIVLWDQGNNVLYLCGELIGESAQHELTELIHTSIRPRSIQLGRPYFKTRALTPSIEALLESLFHGIALRELPTLLYTLTNARPAPQVEGIQLLPIDRALLANTVAGQHRAYSRRDPADVAIRGALLRKGLWLGRRQSNASLSAGVPPNT